MVRAFLLMLLAYLSKFFDVRIYVDGALGDILGSLFDIPFGVLADDVFCIGAVFAAVLSPTLKAVVIALASFSFSFSIKCKLSM